MRAAGEIKVFCAAVLFVIAGCSKHSAAPTTIVDAAGGDAAAASSAPDVKRYDDETAVDRGYATIELDDTNVFDAVPSGNVLATLKNGDAIDLLASRTGFYLVGRPSTGPAPTILGWIAKFAIHDRAAFPARKKVVSPHCDASMQSVFQDRPRCAYACKSTRECRDQGSCDSAIVLPGTGEIPATLSFATVCTAAPDAGADPTSEVPSLFGSPRRMDGSCANGFALAPRLGKLCYRSCKVDSDCPKDARCKAARDAKLCFAN